MSKVAKAVKAVLSPVAADKLADLKACALLALGSATLAYNAKNAEAQEIAGSEWEQYVRATAHGATRDELTEAMLAAVEYDDDWESTQARARQYARRVKVLAGAGILLLRDGGELNESPIMAGGKEVSAKTLGGYAQELLKAGAGKARGTKARADGKGEGEEADGEESAAPVAIQPNPETVPLTAALAARLAQGLFLPGGETLRAALIGGLSEADAFTFSREVFARHINLKAARETSAKVERERAEAKKAEQDARIKAAQEANAAELKAAGLRVTKGKRTKARATA